MSNLLHLPAVIHYAGAAKPLRILDIGVGMGTYGFLLREFLDISQERVVREEWELVIDGIEIFEGYRNPIWDYAYNSVRLENILNVVDELPQYDVILCNDVLEHFRREVALDLLRKLLVKCRVLIATTPNIEIPQGAWGGNDAETHLCVLQPGDFPDLVTWSQTGITNCYVCCSDADSSHLIKQAKQSCPTVKLPRSSLLVRGIKKIARVTKFSRP